MRFKIWMTAVMLITLLHGVVATNDTIVEGEDCEIDNGDAPRMLKKTGRKHCFVSPLLFCRDGKRCCTHLYQKKIWCCDRSQKCGTTPHTCIIHH
jgi:hypothetical protein